MQTALCQCFGWLLSDSNYQKSVKMGAWAARQQPAPERSLAFPSSANSAKIRRNMTNVYFFPENQSKTRPRGDIYAEDVYAQGN
jgi:hypothetical protein